MNTHLLGISVAMFAAFRQYLLNELLNECDILELVILEPPVIFGNIVHCQNVVNEGVYS